MSNSSFNEEKTEYQNMTPDEREKFICDSIKLFFSKCFGWSVVWLSLWLFIFKNDPFCEPFYATTSTILTFSLAWISIFICPFLIVKFGISTEGNGKELVSQLYTTAIALSAGFNETIVKYSADKSLLPSYSGVTLFFCLSAVFMLVYPEESPFFCTKLRWNYNRFQMIVLLSIFAAMPSLLDIFYWIF